jgi:hypothetical protein
MKKSRHWRRPVLMKKAGTVPAFWGRDVSILGLSHFRTENRFPLFLKMLPAYDVVRSNTPPEAFSLRETSAYSDSICRRSESPVLASGIDTMRRPLR